MPDLEGLEDVFLTVRIPRQDLDFDALAKRASKWASFDVLGTASDRRLRGTMAGGKVLPRGHAHLFVSLNNGDWVVNLEAYTTPAKGIPKVVPDLSAILGVLARNTSDAERTRAALIGARYSLSLRDWNPAIPLPIEVSKAGEVSLPGRPRISGLDIDFEDREQPLDRVFVTTYSTIGRLVVKLLIRHEGMLANQLVEDMLALPGRHLSTFATKS